MNNAFKTPISSVILRQKPKLKELYCQHKLEINCQFDKMSIFINQVDSKFLLQDCYSIGMFDCGETYSKGTRFITNEGFKFSLHEHCLNPYSEYFYKVVINPKKTDSIDEIFNVFDRITGKLTPTNHKLGRVDINYIIPEGKIDVDILKLTSLMKWKRKSSHFCSQRLDFNYGELTGIQSNGSGVAIKIYSENEKKKALGHCDFPDYIKIEFQINARSIQRAGIRTIFDLIKIPQTNLLDRLRIFDIIYFDKRTKKQLKKIEDFQIETLQYGFTQAKKRLNKKLKNNFHRNYIKSGILRSLHINNGRTDLNEYFRRSFLDWLNNWLVSNCSNRELIREPLITKSWRFTKAAMYSDFDFEDLS